MSFLALVFMKEYKKFKVPADIPDELIFLPDSFVKFDSPRSMYVWRECNPGILAIRPVISVESNGTAMTRVTDQSYLCEIWDHCAIVPEEPRITNRVLSRWLAHGFGERIDHNDVMGYVSTYYDYEHGAEDQPVPEGI